MTLLRRSLLATALLAAGGAYAADAASTSPSTSAALTSAASTSDVPTGPLPRTVVPSLVQLELKLDPRQERFSGTTRIQVDVAEATDVIWMHGRGLKISSAKYVPVNGRNQDLAVAEAHVSGVLKLTAPKPIQPGKGMIELVYDAPYGQTDGAYRVKPDGSDYVLTQMEALGARGTWPGFDEPSFKQPWDITLIVPEGDVAVANTAETKTEKLADGWKKVTYARTEALPSYLIAFAVGPWDLPKGPDIAPNGSRTTAIPLRGVAAKGQGGKMTYSLANTPKIVLALEDYFGVPYPFDKLDNLAAPDFAAGAMENAGLIVYRDSLMFPDESSAVGQRQGFLSVSAHELAHQWFGDLVTMRWWDDLWLNEAFATWMGNKIHGQLDPQAHTDRGILQGALGAMGADSLASTRRIHQPINDFTEIQSAFDGITYQKGGAVLAMFENFIGEDAFRTGVRNYIKAHARGNATSNDLIEALAAQSKDPAGVKASFLSFIDQPGVPFLNVEIDCSSGKTPALVLRQQRFLPLGSTASAAQTWGIPLSVRYDDGGTIREQSGLVSGAQARFELSAAQSCPAWVMPNAHGTGYYRFALAPKLQQALSANFAKLDEREQRVYADSVTAAYSAGTLTPAQMLAALPQFVTSDVRQTVLAGIGNIDWIREQLIQGEAERKAFLAQAATIYRPRLQQLGLTEKAGESDEDRLLRNSLVGTFAYTFKDPAVRAELGKQGRAVLGLGTDGKLNPDATSRERRGVALGVAVDEGGVAAFDLAEKHFRSAQDPVLRSQLLGALSGTKDAKLGARVRAMVLEPGLLRRNEIYVALGGQTQEETRAALRTWLDANFDAAAARLAPGGAGLAGFDTAGACSVAEADAFQAKYAERLKDMEGGPMQVKQTVEAIKLCAAAKDARTGQPLRFATK